MKWPLRLQRRQQPNSFLSSSTPQDTQGARQDLINAEAACTMGVQSIVSSTQLDQLYEGLGIYFLSNLRYRSPSRLVLTVYRRVQYSRQEEGIIVVTRALRSSYDKQLERNVFLTELSQLRPFTSSRVRLNSARKVPKDLPPYFNCESFLEALSAASASSYATSNWPIRPSIVIPGVDYTEST